MLCLLKETFLAILQQLQNITLIIPAECNPEKH
jgi:hypothetical protein